MDLRQNAAKMRQVSGHDKSHFRETDVLFRKDIHFWKVPSADLLYFPHYFHAAFFGDVDLCSRFENKFQGRVAAEEKRCRVFTVAAAG